VNRVVAFGLQHKSRQGEKNKDLLIFASAMLYHQLVELAPGELDLTCTSWIV